MAVNNKRNIAIIVSIIAAICVIIAIAAVLLLNNNSKNNTAASDSEDTLFAPETQMETSADTTVPVITETEENSDTYAVDPLPSTSGEQKITDKVYELNGPAGSLKINYPEVDNSIYGENADKFNAFIASVVETYKGEFEMQSSVGNTCSVTYKIYKNNDGMISLVFTEVNDSGGAHPSTNCRAVNFALISGQELALKDQFGGSDEYKAEIAKLVYDKVKQNPETYFEGMNEQGIADVFNDNNYYLTDKGITVFFQEYDIAPFAAGIPEFEISYSDMASYMIF